MSCKNPSWFFIVFFALLVSCSGRRDKLVRYVDPFIGTGGHGHTYPGASMPFGMVQLSPDTRLEGWDGCSAYHASDSILYGFSHTHLSGTGCLDYGDILLMPVTGNVRLENYDYASPFKSTSEVAAPGYYRVYLEKYQVKAELTATLRAGFHRYTFPATDQAGIVIDLKHRDKVLESGIRISGKNEISGFRFSQSWARHQMIYFVAQFSRPFNSFAIESDGKPVPGGVRNVQGNSLKALFSFTTLEKEKILVKVGISAVSPEGARNNLESEIPGWDFDETVRQSSDAWDKELGKIVVQGGSDVQKRVFYTALYHSLLNPYLYMDVDGQYRGRDLQIHKASGFDYYTLFSLWDTYRAAHPLYTIIEGKRTNDFINTFLQQYEEGGLLPVWELSANETGCMIGYHSVPVIADAFQKGIRGYDVNKAYEAMKHSAEQDHLGLSFFRSRGYIPGDMEGESVSKTLEYAYDDWCIAGMALKLGKMEDYRTYIRYAQNYKNIFDPGSGFMRAKMNETWFTPFDPAEVNFNYTEANAWQYSFYVPQDLDGLIVMLGGKEKFVEKLDDMFRADPGTTGRQQADISGMIGQYAHGNEPSHHMAYLYCFAGQPWKTQELVHKICKELYSNTRDGLCGNEDCGQMSSWYVLSALGFYPVTPASGIYVIGTPLFEKATIHLENGKTFTIKAEKLSDGNFYIQSANLNGTPYLKIFLNHSDIMKGGELVLVMGPEPEKNRGTKPCEIPVSGIKDELITPVPAVEQGERTFMDSTVVRLSCPEPGATIYFALDGSELTRKSKVFSAPITLKNTTVLKAFACAKGMSDSFVIKALFEKVPKNRKITLYTKYASQYAAGGDNALINFIRGGENFRTGNWQGYEGVDLDVVIDLGKSQTIHKLSIGCLQDIGSWIFFPINVMFFTSRDGKNFIKAESITGQAMEKTEGAMIREFTVSLPDEKAKYIKVVARNRGICPPWHAGAGGKAWIFADEITIE